MSTKPAKVIIGQTHSDQSDPFSGIFQKDGIEIELIQEGSRILDTIRATPQPDLLVMDSSVNGPGALEICRVIKADPELNIIPVVLLIAEDFKGDQEAAVDAGFDDILLQPVSPSLLLARVQSLLRLKQLTDDMDDAESVLFTLTRTMEAKDLYTMGHADRVAHYAVDLGKALGVSKDELVILRKGGMLHDIGKIAIPDAILTKPGKYTPEEFGIMKKHPVLGCQICQKLKSMRDALPLIRHHHEKLDGKGYPDGLKGNQIPSLVRVVTVVDIYDALRSKRSYKDAFTLDKSFQIMWEEASKGWWDKDLLSCWEKIARG